MEQYIALNGLADLELFPEKKGISSLLSELEDGMFDAALSPYHNTIAGPYSDTIRGIEEHDLILIGEITLRIVLRIGIHPESQPDLITEIWSKDSALAECSEYLSREFPKAKRVPVESTALGMEAIIERGLMHVAAVGSQSGIKLYRLTELAAGIENRDDNFTTISFLRRLEKD